MAAGRIRNRGCVPFIESEGVFLKPLVIQKNKKDVCFDQNVPHFNRLHMHQTLASARRYAFFKNFENLIPNDELDFVLSSTFDESKEFFPEKVDVYLQPETVGQPSFRRLRNTRDLTPDREQMASNLSEEQAKKVDKSKDGKPKKAHCYFVSAQRNIPHRYNFAHKLLIGGVTKRKHPSSMKLINSSHHSPQTNAGYSRQPSDGNFYQY